jgi:alkylation response protein AidB-like acyl-CoA dehydrogenase
VTEVLTGSAERWREAARAFANEWVIPVAERIDRDDRVPPELLRELARQRFLGLGTPESWGGSGGDRRAIAGVLEEFSRASATVGVLLSVHISVAAAPILAWGTDAQREKYLRPLATGQRIGAFGLTEPDVGSDPARLRSRYRRADGGFVLDGRKMFISNAIPTATVLIFATSDPALGRRGISAFVVPADAPGFSIAQRLEKLGLRGSETTEIALDGVRVPEDGLLGPEGGGLRMALSSLAGGRVGIASCALGVARAAFDEMRRNARESDADWKRGVLARAYSELAAAEALVERAAVRTDTGPAFVRAASVAKLVASRAAVTIALEGLDVAGEAGARTGSRAERLLRDARVFPIVEGTTEIQEMILARELMTEPNEPNPL